MVEFLRQMLVVPQVVSTWSMTARNLIIAQRGQAGITPLYGVPRPRWPRSAEQTKRAM